MNLINLTPHALNVQHADGSVITLPASGQVARVATERKPLTKINGVQIWTVVFGEIEGLPERQPKTGFIVSAMVLAQVKALARMSSVRVSWFVIAQAMSLPAMA